MRALLDVNVLIALLDAGHVQHIRATRWLERQISEGWASCPLTQNGCLRIMVQPSYPKAQPLNLVASRLAHAAANPAHAFIADDYSVLDRQRIDFGHLLGHRQITDAYLLGLAVHHHCCFATFDARIDAAVVLGARPAHLVIL